VRQAFHILVLGLAAAGCGDGPSTLTSPSFVIGGGVATNPGGAATIGYTLDTKLLFDASCTRCHNSRSREGGVDLSSYAAVLRTLQPGNANSELIRQSRSGGSMYRYWRGDAAAQADLVRRWIVEFQARENR
jgi:Planctomycete cytochrome C